MNIRPLPHHGNRDFLAAAADIERIMLAKLGLVRRDYTGSISWSAPNSKSVSAKLVFRGAGRPYVFGFRLDLIEAHERLRELLPFPLLFAVLPAPDVVFGGWNIAVGAVAPAIQRIQKIVARFPASASSPVMTADDEFDRRLEALAD